MSNQLEPKSIILGWYSKKEILKNSVCEVQLPLSFDSFGHPVPDGLYDVRMGVIQRDQECGTCGQHEIMCTGHVGHITLSSPVVNPLMYERLLVLLRTMCLKCHSFKITDFQRMSVYIKLKALKRNIMLENSDAFVRDRTTDEIEKDLYAMGTEDSLQSQLHYRTVDDFFKKYASRTKCPRCGAKLIKISKGSRMRVLVHGKKKDGGYEPTENGEPMSPREMMELIGQLYANEAALLAEFFNGGDKEMFFLDVLPVIPNKFRPARFVNKEVYENPVNAQLARIIQASNALEADTNFLAELQENVYYYFDGSKTPRKPTVGVKQVLERKEGLFRSNIMGKRVNYSGRSVISPDPSLHSREVGIPLMFAQTLTFPEKVTAFNVEKLREVVRNGTNYPGCNYVECDGVLTNMAHISTGMRLAIARQLSSGRKVVWRHMVDGDHVLLNRQPTLHSVGLMGHRVRVLREGSTFRIHYVNCKSYNADFDGDEMNIHFPQSFPAMAECRLLASTDNNYCVQSTGAPIRGLEQDHIVGAATLTFKDSFFTRDEYFQLIHNGLQMNDWSGRVRVVQPCIVWPVALYSGKQVVSSLFLSMKISTNYSTTGKLLFNRRVFRGESVCDVDTSSNISVEEYCKQENTFLVRDGILVSGVLDKKTVGASANSFVHACGEIYGFKICNDILAAVSGVVNAYLRNRGFTVRFDDLLMDRDYDRNRHRIFQRSNDEAVAMQENDPDLFKNDHFHLDDDETRRLDSRMRQFMNDSISEAINAMEGGLFKKRMRNNMATIILSGAKGSIVNLSQITCALGQQELESRRVPFMRSGKTLPCFARLEKCPAAGGCVYERFLTGLNPATFYFYCMAGREGLIDTAVKTANSGYLQRSLIKHLEGIKVDYDGTVRNGKRLIQYNYGDDGLDCLKTYFINIPDFYAQNMHLFKDFYRKKEKRHKVCGLDSTASSSSKDDGVGSTTENDVDRTHDKGINEDSASFKEFVSKKREVARIDPGKCVGILAAQSIGEPSTQMTLNTFHLAGVGGKNVTLGIPRLREILMVGSKRIKTPVIIAKIRSSSQELVDVFKRHTLSDCLDEIRLTECIITRGGQYCKKINIQFVLNKMEDRCVTAIQNNFHKMLAKEIKKKNSSVAIDECPASDFSKALDDEGKSDYADSTVNESEETEAVSSVRPEEECFEEEIRPEKLTKLDSRNYVLEIIYPNDFSVFLMPLIENVAEKLVVREIPGFSKASVDGDKLIMEGSNFSTIHSTYFGINLTEAIDWTDSYSNDIYAIYCYFGVEAARTCIVQEIKNVFDVYGIYINIRHLYLIADYMTKDGDFRAFNRSAFTMDDSFIQKMSFESCYLNLKKSAIFQQNEVITNPSTSILLGSRMKQGTGSFDLLYNISSNLNE